MTALYSLILHRDYIVVSDNLLWYCSIGPGNIHVVLHHFPTTNKRRIILYAFIILWLYSSINGLTNSASIEEKFSNQPELVANGQSLKMLPCNGHLNNKWQLLSIWNPSHSSHTCLHRYIVPFWNQDDSRIENLPLNQLALSSHSNVSREGETINAGQSYHSAVSGEGGVQVQASRL